MQSIPKLLPALTVAILAGPILPASYAVDNTWQSAVAADWATVGNWVNGIPDTTTERAVFNGTGTLNDVTFAAAVGGGTGFGGILVDAGQTSALTISNAAAGILNFRLASGTGITINAGAGAFSLGTSGSDIRLVPQANSTFTFQNDSSSTATLGSKITSTTGGGNAPFTLLFTGSGNWQVDAVINPSTVNGASSITKSGTGTTTLAGSNTFTGTTTVNDGTLKLSNSLALQNSTLASGGTGIIFDSSVGTHAFTIGGLGGSGDLALQDNSSNAVTLTLGNNAATYSGVLSAAGGLTKMGTGTQTLSGANTYSGTTTINGSGTTSYTALKVSSDTALGGTAGGTTLNGGTATASLGTALELAAGVTVTGESLTINANTGRASLSLSTAGSAAWNGNVTISDSTALAAINSGNAGSNLTIGASSSNTLTLTGINNFLRGAGSGTVNSKITGSGSLQKTDAGSWTITNAENDYSGNTTVNTGILSITKIADSGQTSSIGTGTSITLGQNSGGAAGVGTLQFAGASDGSTNRNVVINNGAAGGGGTIENTEMGQNLTLRGDVTAVDPANASFFTLQGAGSGVLSGSITGAPLMSLTKSGPGTWTVAGTNSYTGATTVSDGTLLVTGSISGSTVTVDAGILGGSGTVDATTVNAGGTLSPGLSIGTLNFSSTLTLAGTAVIEINKLGAALSADLANVTGLLTLGGALNVTATGDALVAGDSFNLFDADSFAGSFTTVNLPALDSGLSWDTSGLTGNGSITVVPEPSAAIAIVGGAALLLGLRRRK